MNCSILIKEIEDDEEHFKVFDTTSYICRSIGENIQKEVKWTYEPDDFDIVHEVRLKLKCKGVDSDICQSYCQDNKYCKEGIIFIDKQTLDRDFNVNENDIKGYQVPLDKVMHPIDNLHVELTTCYSIKKNKMFTWAMTHPSKGISFTINFPENYNLSTFVGGVEPKEYSKNFNGNMYIFNYDGWFLPRAGLAWNLSKK